MPRIRTIKPEFPQSESVGRLSRDARLCFIMLWTLADDSGRLRGNSRMLASLLYPYDDDAGKHIDGWLKELETESCIVRYSADNDTYLQVCNWLKHQKIDKPSQSKIPPFDESSRILANPRERSSGDLRIKDQGSSKSGFAASPVKAADPRKAIFDLGVSVLGKDARSLIAKALKHSTEHDVFSLLGAMAVSEKANPREYFCAALKSSEDKARAARMVVP